MLPEAASDPEDGAPCYDSGINDRSEDSSHISKKAANGDPADFDKPEASEHTPLHVLDGAEQANVLRSSQNCKLPFPVVKNPSDPNTLLVMVVIRPKLSQNL